MEVIANAYLSVLVSDGALSCPPKKYGCKLYDYDSDVGLVDIQQIVLQQSHAPPPGHQESLVELAHYQLQHKQPLEGGGGS